MKKILASILLSVCALVCALTACKEVYLATQVSKSVSAFSSSASSYIVMEANTGTVLAKSNEMDKRKMASTTKILTCITALENFDDINKIVTVPNKAVGIEGSSIYLKKNQQIKFIDLLYGLMLRSGNDAATAISYLVAGGESEFATLMNETAKKAGATNSHFVNPHGLDHAEHYTTAEDLAKITAYALKNPTFKQITKTSMHKTSATETTEPQFFYNKNKILHMVDGAIGVKTGYTKKAGRCLVSAAERDGMQIVCVVLNCGPMFEDSKNMINEAFNKYTLVNPQFENVCVNVNGGLYECVCAQVDGKFSKLMLKTDAEKIEYKTTFNTIEAGSPAGTLAGKIDIVLNGEILQTLELKTCCDAPKKDECPNCENDEFVDIVKDLIG